MTANNPKILDEKDCSLPKSANEDSHTDGLKVVQAPAQENVGAELDVSIIIPVYNEQERIAATLYTVKDHMESSKLRFEIVVVDDGSSDMTAEIVKFVDLYGSEIKSQQLGYLDENVKNIGKGYSIAKGMLRAKGSVAVFTDADSATPITEISKLLNKLDEGYDVVIGSRNHPQSIVDGRSPLRKVLSKSFNMIARILGLLNVRDSQCGFKAYRRDVAHEVARLQKTYGFCFDVEHLHIARKLGYRVTEVPVKWSHAEGSTMSLFSDSLLMAIDLLKIRFIHRHLKRNKTANESDKSATVQK